APLPARPRALRRCLQNLLDNALRYGNSDGEADAPVEIVLHDAPQALCICIRDRGPGLPAAELERVFEPFRRLEHSRSRATGGTGLGLSIARAIARGHGGELTLANRSDGPGLEARLTLPRRPLAGAR
ncbi:MAG TPA: ATP-binding protein, partial [Plasticicumulans sp.]|nr:ATP-binding protein [Plasticicumulans sp.]